ncbi:MAG TPA: hydroxymethylbilane synthase [Tepidisphaeraceae bacterium]|jgi:hydroxymethylbilane synthase|nr:hydroxymethylbilane synthase [Tepidisphaeraceae bacterium]
MADSNLPHLRLGTRGSLLARTQSGIVALALEQAHRGLQVELITFKTTGDQITERPLHEFGGKGLFTKELEQALLAGRIDFAVHSFKDMPTTMPLVEQDELMVAAVPAREDCRDALVGAGAMSIGQLPRGARVGTGSMRRRCQLLHRRPDLAVEAIRGNIDTRLRKQREGQFDAIVLAMAGIRRVGLFDSQTMLPIEPHDILPAPGQGALALQCRRDDVRTRMILSALMDESAALCVAAERELVRLLKGDCLSPIAALAEMRDGRLRLRAAVGARGGALPVIFAVGESAVDRPLDAAAQAHASLVEQNVESILHG